MKYITTVNGNEYEIIWNEQGQVTVNGEAYSVDLNSLGNGDLISMLLNNHSFEAVVDSAERDRWEILMNGENYDITVKDERAYRLARARGELDNDTGMVPTKSPMPGVIVNVLVEVGQMISKGETMVILESMKMENELKATRDGKVFEIKVSAGQTVEKDALLVVVGDEEPAE
ncbi:MAG: biotin carboxyl carrier protein [Candidatus Promineifilaceae bacterium]|jgi:biotin carboxyl carrier protein